MKRDVLIACMIIGIAALAILLHDRILANDQALENTQSIQDSEAIVADMTRNQYSDPQGRFKIIIPEGYVDSTVVPPLDAYRINTDSVYQLGPDERTTGVAFMIPKRFVLKSSLSEDTSLQIQFADAMSGTCSPADFLGHYVQLRVSTSGPFVVASTTQKVDGDIYDRWAYVIPGIDPCAAIVYYIHYTDQDNTANSSSTVSFDREALLRSFDAIRDTVRFDSASTQVKAR